MKDDPVSAAGRGPGVDPTARPSELSTRIDQLLLARYAPPGVVVDEKLDILQFRGQTGAYLEPAPGEPQYNLLPMARGGLHAALRATVAEARKGSSPVRATDIAVDQDGFKRTCDIVVIPLQGAPDGSQVLYLILFEDHPPPQGPGPQLVAGDEELAAAKAERQASHEELTTAVDALKQLIDQAQQANVASERANRIKDEVLATLSHELRTPLSSMLMRAQLLGRGGMDAVKVQRAGEAIAAGVKLQVRLIDDLIDVSRIVMGKLTLDLQPVDLAQIVTRTLDGLGPAIARRSLQLTVDLGTGESRARIHGDGARLQQIVTNLLTNAIKYTPEHGTIAVSLALADGTAIVSVKDSGMGIDPDFLPHVFDRFTQEDGATTRLHAGLGMGGLGLGLAIVRHLVELHHGTVKAESPGSGEGSTFSVTFPRIKALRDQVPGATPAPERSAIDIALLQGLRILVLDDDLATRDAIADLLGQAGADVRGAQSAVSAMAMIDAFDPALLICDIALPGENGYAFLRRLRARGAEQCGDIPALALTVLAHDDERERALRAGFQIHLAKPVDIDRLTEAVLELAASRRAPPRSP